MQIQRLFHEEKRKKEILIIDRILFFAVTPESKKAVLMWQVF
jgi:hypothetical protein